MSLENVLKQHALELDASTSRMASMVCEFREQVDRQGRLLAARAEMEGMIANNQHSQAVGAHTIYGEDAFNRLGEEIKAM